MTDRSILRVALLGRRDRPTDGVQDYCIMLADALLGRGVGLQVRHLEWTDVPWMQTVRWLSTASNEWVGRWVLVQYTHLMWPYRGFPIGFLGLVYLLKRKH